MRWIDAARARLDLILSRRAAEQRFDEEIRFHIEMEAEKLVREHGLSESEARRRAMVAFGGVERYREELRDGRGLAWLGGLSLDVRLGLRMLVKHPGLAVVGVVGLAVAVAIAAVSFGVIYGVVDPTLPLPGGDRIVAIQNVDQRPGVDEGRRTHLHDLAEWRASLGAVPELGAYRTVDRNLVGPDGRVETARVAEMTATGFHVARTAPLLGRHLTADDERPDAPAVVVIGHDAWRSRFAGDTAVVGRALQIGATRHTVVGVMPQGFAFPVNNRFWTPLRLRAADFARGEAPPIDVFGRLADAATLRDAEAQLAAVGREIAARHPTTHAHLQPRLLPYPRAFLDSPELTWAFHLVQLLVSMLLVVIGTNVAVLVNARTAARAGEIAVRSALGASRGRIVAQLFAEALVLSGIAAALGLAAAWGALRRVRAFAGRTAGEQLPFWMEFDVSSGLVAYVAGLAVLGAVIVGVLPALGATRGRLQPRLQQLGTGGGMRLGRRWTALIVAQVSVTVAVLPVVLAGAGAWLRAGMADRGIAAEFLIARLHLDRDVAGAAIATDVAADAADAARHAALQAEVVRRLRAEPAVAGVVLADAAPGDEPSVRIEVEGGRAADDAGHPVSGARVQPGWFDAFGVPLLEGRDFGTGDARAEGTAVIVNRSFVRAVLGGGPALGRRVRLADGDGDAAGAAHEGRSQWAVVVGVVPDFPRPVDAGAPRPVLYRPLAAGASRSLTLAVRVRGGEAPAAVAERLRAVAARVDPMLRLAGVVSLDDALRDGEVPGRTILLAVGALALSVLLLSAAGIYALVSFTVVRRRREIGLRSALGAGARRVVGMVLARALGQVGLGIAVGVATAALLDRATGGGMLDGHAVLLLPGVAGLMLVVSLLAALGPARRALRIQPTEALKAE